MPMIPEAAIAILACARIGAIHSVVFAGFSSTALKDRINDCEAKAVLTSDGNFRGEKIISVKNVVDEAIENSKSVKTVIVAKRTGQEVKMKPGRDYWWDDIISDQPTENIAEEMDSEDMLFILIYIWINRKTKRCCSFNCRIYDLYLLFIFKCFSI